MRALSVASWLLARLGNQKAGRIYLHGGLASVSSLATSTFSWRAIPLPPLAFRGPLRMAPQQSPISEVLTDLNTLLQRCLVPETGSALASMRVRTGLHPSVSASSFHTESYEGQGFGCAFHDP